MSVRGAAADRRVVVPDGTQRISIRLGRDTDSRPFTTAHASIGVVGGEDVWAGVLIPPTGADSIGSIDVAASQLPAEDYVITVHGATSDGRQQSTKYFLRIGEP